MPIVTNKLSVSVAGQKIPFSSFPDLVETHIDNVLGTRELETMAANLRAADYPVEDLREFIRVVCRWGGWAGIAGRVRRDNSDGHIRKCFKTADLHLKRAEPRVGDAMSAVNLVKGLGKPSYCSKHLRFLSPDTCPILDSMIAGDLGYSYDVAGYEQLSEDLRNLGRVLEMRKVANPMKRSKGRWFAGDVDMALFAWVRNARGQLIAPAEK